MRCVPWLPPKRKNARQRYCKDPKDHAGITHKSTCLNVSSQDLDADAGHQVDSDDDDTLRRSARVQVGVVGRPPIRLLVVAPPEPQRYYRRPSAMSVRRIEEARPS